jgi:hypothetical protein
MVNVALQQHDLRDDCISRGVGDGEPPAFTIAQARVLPLKVGAPIEFTAACCGDSDPLAAVGAKVGANSR